MSKSSPEPNGVTEAMPIVDRWIAVFEDEQAHGADHCRTLQALREVRREAALSVDRERDRLVEEKGRYKAALALVVESWEDWWEGGDEAPDAMLAIYDIAREALSSVSRQEGEEG